MRIVLSGAERGASRRLLMAQKVERMGVNVTQLHIPDKKPLDLQDKFGDAELWVYTSDTDEDIDRYAQFLSQHHEALHTVIGRPDYDGKWLGSKYVPLWNDGEDLDRLAFLMERNDRVCVSDKALSPPALARIEQYANRWGTKVIAFTSKMDFINAFSWDAVLVVHWTSVMKYGETQVWDGRQVKRYGRQQSQSARAQHRSDITRLGVDADKVLAGDSDELAALSIRSWLELEMSAYRSAMTEPTPGQQEPTDPSEGVDSNDSGVPTDYPKTGSSDLTLTTAPPEKRHESEQKLLPILSLTETAENGDPGQETPAGGPDSASGVRVAVSRSGQNLRQCDSCYLAARCPEYTPGSECAYRFPVRLTTFDELKRMCSLILELQVERAMFGVFAEQLEGQGADAAVSKELDRVFKMVEAIRSLNDDRDILSLKLEARSGAGVIERIFGSGVKEQMNQLPQPVDTNAALESLGIVDAEVVGEDS